MLSPLPYIDASTASDFSTAFNSLASAVIGGGAVALIAHFLGRSRDALAYRREGARWLREQRTAAFADFLAASDAITSSPTVVGPQNREIAARSRETIARIQVLGPAYAVEAAEELLAVARELWVLQDYDDEHARGVLGLERSAKRRLFVQAARRALSEP